MKSREERLAEYDHLKDVVDRFEDGRWSICYESDPGDFRQIDAEDARFLVTLLSLRLQQLRERLLEQTNQPDGLPLSAVIVPLVRAMENFLILETSTHDPKVTAADMGVVLENATSDIASAKDAVAEISRRPWEKLSEEY